jgi:phosphoglycolate phosphatase-like HAD superfamily hydrolase
MARPAVLLDIDGTLVDSNYLHVQAWSEALQDIGHPVDEWRIHRGIGMDSGKLLAALLGDRVDELAEAAKDWGRWRPSSCCYSQPQPTAALLAARQAARAVRVQSVTW